MTSDNKERRAIGKQLKQARAVHKEQLAGVEKARAKLEKRSRKLKKLERRMMELEARLYVPSAGASVDGAASLRPARLIFNPGSGKNASNPRSLEDIVTTLRAHGIDADVGVKTSGKASRELAKEAADAGQALVIVAGGDGTIEDVASQLIGTQTVLGILPVGSMNNLARSLGVPLDLDAACALIGAGVTRKIDIGNVVTQAKPQVKYFMESAAIGLTAIAFPAGQAAKKGRLARIPQAVRRLLDFKSSPVLVELDPGETILAQSQLITISNAPLIGLNFMIAPGAKMDDGLLDIAVYDEMSKGEILTYYMAIMNGKPADNSKIKRYRAKRVLIHSARTEPIVSDKDQIADKSKIEIEVLPQALSVIAGDGVGLTLPLAEVPAAVPNAPAPAS